jgi:hypothetical protein
MYKVYASVERADTLHLFIFYPYRYSVHRKASEEADNVSVKRVRKELSSRLERGGNTNSLAHCLV